jgi:hypothetical protein
VLFARFLLTFLLVFAVPIQTAYSVNVAMCRDDAVGRAASENMTPASDQGIDQHPHANSQCATCSMSCCQPEAYPVSRSSAMRLTAHGRWVTPLPLSFKSWTEPVPRKPPRT